MNFFLLSLSPEQKYPARNTYPFSIATRSSASIPFLLYGQPWLTSLIVREAR